MSDTVNSVEFEEKMSEVIDKPKDSADSQENLAAMQSYEDMRSSPRKDFPCTQRIAPMHGKDLPLPDEYINVECKNISCGGIAFYAKRRPGCKHFSVALGQKPAITMLIAQVVHISEVECNNQRMYLVGCKFIDRIED
ncbi:MAG TPA: hypothetical protein VIH42_12450 [Thermoguttaceae bacterium]